LYTVLTNRGDKNMAFVIKSDKKESENKTIRFPVDVISDIEKVIVGKEVSFSGFVVQACRYALDNLANSEKSTEKKQ